VVLASGMAASPFAAQVPGARDELGRVVVDTALRAPAAPEVFVAGDAAAADTGDGHWTLQSCQHANQLGRVAGENAARDLLGLSPVPYTQLRYVTCLDLGRSGAVITQGWERRVEKTGNEGKTVKRLINTQVIYPPADGTAEALLASSSINLAERAGRVDGPKAGLVPAPGKAA
jgi:NADH dehydrogenase